MVVELFDQDICKRMLLIAEVDTQVAQSTNLLHLRLSYHPQRILQYIDSRQEPLLGYASFQLIRDKLQLLDGIQHLDHLIIVLGFRREFLQLWFGR